jgi:DNA repair exonuclease SbcCD ATPase subunit
MPDIADDRAAYLEAMRRAEAASGIERDAEGNETNGIEAIVRGETPVATPELQGAVPVQASDQPLAAEPAAEEAAATSEQQQEAPAEALTVEQLQEKLADAEARLAEKDSFIGRQSGEVGELRRVVDELSARVNQAQQPAPVATPQVLITQDLIDADPARATQLAFQQKDESALALAFEAWRDEDPFTASTWLSDQRLAQQQAAFDAKLAEVEGKIQTVAAPMEATVAQNEWNGAFHYVEQQRPGFLQQAERLLSEVAPKFPNIVGVLSNGDAAAKSEVLMALYDLDRVSNPEQIKQELEQQVQEATAEAAAARTAAGVVTGQTTAGQGSAAEKTVEEQEADAYMTRQRGRPSLSRGWTGRS